MRGPAVCISLALRVNKCARVPPKQPQALSSAVEHHTRVCEVGGSIPPVSNLLSNHVAVVHWSQQLGRTKECLLVVMRDTEAELAREPLPSYRRLGAKVLLVDTAETHSCSIIGQDVR